MQQSIIKHSKGNRFLKSFSNAENCRKSQHLHLEQYTLKNTISYILVKPKTRSREVIIRIPLGFWAIVPCLKHSQCLWVLTQSLYILLEALKMQIFKTPNNWSHTIFRNILRIPSEIEPYKMYNRQKLRIGCLRALMYL